MKPKHLIIKTVKFSVFSKKTPESHGNYSATGSVFLPTPPPTEFDDSCVAR